MMMMGRIGHWLRAIARGTLVIGLIVTLTLGFAHDAQAARSGGRMGGGSFSSPRRSYSAPQRTVRSTPTYSTRSPFGGGFGFPFLIPFFAFGGGFGGIFSLLIGLALLNFIIKAFRNSGLGSGGGSQNADLENPTITVAQVQVGLLSGARSLQGELNTLAETVDASTASGRARIVQETTLALLRNPDYWMYGSAETVTALLDQAEAKFNQYSLTERSKFTTETLSNINSDRQNSTLKPSLEKNTSLAQTVLQEAGEYLIVTVLIGTQDKLTLPAIENHDSLKAVLQKCGAVGSDRLLAVEVIWTPQAEGDTLTTDDLIAQYPDLKLL